jgi:phospholipid/cholesterol/gamma-HCH transport system permease protein
VVALFAVFRGGCGVSLAGLRGVSRFGGLSFTPAVTLVFVLKTWFFSLTVAIMPMASGLYAPLRRHRLGGAALGGFARMFAVLLLIEVISLMGNYY